MKLRVYSFTHEEYLSLIYRISTKSRKIEDHRDTQDATSKAADKLIAR